MGSTVDVGPTLLAAMPLIAIISPVVFFLLVVGDVQGATAVRDDRNGFDAAVLVQL